eukprot:222220-Pyramimonas_sp.AAC.1
MDGGVDRQGIIVSGWADADMRNVKSLEVCTKRKHHTILLGAYSSKRRNIVYIPAAVRTVPIRRGVARYGIYSGARAVRAG